MYREIYELHLERESKRGKWRIFARVGDGCLERKAQLGLLCTLMNSSTAASNLAKHSWIQKRAISIL